MKHFLKLLLLLGLSAIFGGEANGQLLYTTGNNSGQLIIRQVNLNGTGDVGFNFNLPIASEARFSKDGRSIAVSGKTFNQLNQTSTNVFVLDPGSNQPRNITNFTDNRIGGVLTTAQIPFKSFSPDGSLMAVVIQSRITPSATPFGRALAFYHVTGPLAGQQFGPELTDGSFNGTSTSGDGVSWSPVANVIATPTTTSNPQQPTLSGPSPISSFNSAGQFLDNLTFPQAGQLGGVFGPMFVQHDQFPSFSPDGQELAYFRQTRVGPTGINATQLELRVRGQLSPVLSFPDGSLPVGLSWSPDGTQLAFGIATQASELQPALGQLIYSNEPVLSTTSIQVVNRDGSQHSTFLQPIAGFPEYFPRTVNSRLGDVNMDGSVDFLDISPFVSVLSLGRFQAEADCDQSGAVNFLDISPFVAILSGQ